MDSAATETKCRGEYFQVFLLGFVLMKLLNGLYYYKNTQNTLKHPVDPLKSRFYQAHKFDKASVLFRDLKALKSTPSIIYCVIYILN